MQKAKKSKRWTATKPVQSLKADGQRVHQRQGRRPAICIAKENPTLLGLSDLPRELRDMIYEYALASAQSVRLGERSNVGRMYALSLFATCKAVRREATGIFYKKNLFRIDMLCLSPRSQRLRSQGFYGDVSSDRHGEGFRRIVALMGQRTLAKIKSFSFVYHKDFWLHEYPYRHLLERGDVAIRRDFLPRSPYFRITLDSELGKKSMEDVHASFLPQMGAYLQGNLNFRNCQGLAKREVVDFVRHFRVIFHEYFNGSLP